MSKFIIFLFFIFNIVITDNTNKIYHTSSQNIYGVNLSSQGNFYIVSTNYIFEITRQLYISKIIPNNLHQLNKPSSVARTLLNNDKIVLFQKNTIYTFQPNSENQQPTERTELSGDSIISPSILIDDNKIFIFGSVNNKAIINICDSSCQKFSISDDFIYNNIVDCVIINSVIICGTIDYKFQYNTYIYLLKLENNDSGQPTKQHIKDIKDNNNLIMDIDIASNTLLIKFKKVYDFIFIICLLKQQSENNKLYCSTGQLNDNPDNIRPLFIIQDAVLSSCNPVYDLINIEVFDDSTNVNAKPVVLTCNDNISLKYKVALLSVSSTGVITIEKEEQSIPYSNPKTIPHSVPIYISDKNFGLFYNNNTSMYLHLVDTPQCIGINLTATPIYPGQTKSIQMGNYIYDNNNNQNGSNRKFQLKGINQDNTIKLTQGNVDLTDNEPYDSNIEISYTINTPYPTSASTITYLFGSAYDGNEPTQFCNITFKLGTCPTGCVKCEDDKLLHMCTECDTANNYYGVYGEDHFECIQQTDINGESTKKGYYLDVNSKIFKPCDISCKICKENAFQCLKCADYYVQYDTQNTEYSGKCGRSDIIIDKFYLSTDNSEQVLKECHSSCLQCSGGDASNCIKCDNNTYFHTDDILDGLCLSKPENSQSEHPNYYFDDTNNIFIKCHVSCKSCKKKDPDGIQTFCDECDKDNDYYPVKKDDGTQEYQCYKGEINNYYLSSDNYYYPCDVSCSKCKGSTDKDCIECQKGYAQVDYGTNNQQNTLIHCHSITEELSEYIYNENKFEKCGDYCTKCAKNEESIICLECIESYYKVEGERNCITNEGKPGYYIDETNKIFHKCNDACNTCTGAGNTNCKSNDCATGYYPISTQLTTCYSESEGKSLGYVFNGETKQFFGCNVACNSCNELGTTFDTKCVDGCAEGYRPVTGNNSLCFSTTTPPSNVIDNGSTFDLCYISCGSCSAIGSDYMNAYCTSCNHKEKYYNIKRTESSDLLCINEDIKQQHYRHYFFREYTAQFEECNESCKTCTGSSLSCTECNEEQEYYKLYTDNNNAQSTLTCLDKSYEKKGYYLYDTGTSKEFRKCYDSCLMCVRSGDELNHNCIENECIDGYIAHPYNTTQCISPCQYYYYINIDNINKLSCTISNECTDEYPFLIVSKNECVKRCDIKYDSNEYYTLNNNQCIEECPEDTIKDNDTKTCITLNICKKTEYQTTSPASTIAETIDTLASNYITEFSYTDKHVNILTHVGGDYQIVIYKSKECAKEFVTELSTMELECLPKDISLTTLQMTQYKTNGPDQLSYAFYNSETTERIDMSICEGEKIEVDVSISNTGANITQAIEFDKLGVNVYDINHPFFNDICFTFTAENGRDVPLSERKKHYYQDVAFCEDGCELKQINLQTENATCECNVQTQFVSELLDNPLTGEIIELLSNANFEVLQCYKGVFNINNILTNIGGWVIIGFGLIELPFLIFYIKNGLMGIRIYLLQFMGMNPPRKKNVKPNILNRKSSQEEAIVEGDIKQGDGNSKKQKVMLMVVNKNLDNEIFNTNSNASSIFNKESKDELNEPSSDIKLNKNMKMIMNVNVNKEKKKKYEYDNIDDILSNDKKFQEDIIINEKQPISNDNNDNNSKHNDINNNNNDIKYDFDVFHKNRTHAIEEQNNEFSDSELNNLDLFDAIIFDKRTFLQMYWNQLKDKEGIINTFFDHDVLELIPIKSICFFLSAMLYFTLNALFYFEDLIAAEFNHKGPITVGYIFQNQIDRCIYAMLIGTVIDLVLACITGTKGRIKSLIRREKDPERFRDESVKIVKSLRTKILLFLIINFILTAFFWYYVSAFCYCYHNTQVNWLVGGVITWIFSLILPFIYCFLITLLRYIGLKCKLETAYKISVCLSD